MGSDNRVRVHTEESINSEIDRKMEMRVREYAIRSSQDITNRIQELDREWDIERLLEMNASALAFTGLVLGITRNRKWLLVPSLVLPFLFLHATRGWCPPLPMLRRLGVRTREEIDQEKYALKVLRGDFKEVAGPAFPESALAAVRQ